MKTYWKKIISIGQSLLVLGFVFISTVYGQPDGSKAEESLTAKDTSKGLSIIISTTGPVKFRSHWFDEPPRLMIEFLATNVLSHLDEEVIVPHGLIKKIRSTYGGKEENKSLKSLTFELLEKVPYTINQGENKIVLELNAPSQKLENVSSEIETLIAGEISPQTKNITIQRLELMDTALDQIKGSTPLKRGEEIAGISPASIKSGIEQEISEAKEEVVLSDLPPLVQNMESKKKEESKGALEIMFWIVGLPLFLGSFYFVGKKWRLAADRRIKELNVQIQKINHDLAQEKIIRKSIEQTALEKEKKYEQTKHTVNSLNLELQQKKNELVQKEKIFEQTQKSKGEIEKEYTQLKENFESQRLGLQQQMDVLKERETLGKGWEEKLPQRQEDLREVKGDSEALGCEIKQDECVKKILDESREIRTEKQSQEELGTPGPSSERRESPRLTLLKDFTRTIIVSIKPAHGAANLRAFVDNISTQGLSLEAKRDFEEIDLLNLKLLFYGGTRQMPLIKIRGTMIWKKSLDMKNSYGLSFELVDEKYREELNQYIDSELIKVTNPLPDSLEEVVHA